MSTMKKHMIVLIHIIELQKNNTIFLFNITSSKKKYKITGYKTI